MVWGAGEGQKRLLNHSNNPDNYLRKCELFDMGVDFQPNVQHNDGKNFISGMGKSEMLLPCAGGRLKEASMNSQRKCSSKERDVLTKGKGQQLTRGNEKKRRERHEKKSERKKERNSKQAREFILSNKIQKNSKNSCFFP